jgi:CHAT domain-containing protein
LSAVLLDSALAALPQGINRLVIIPDGPLHRLPFDALQLRTGDWVVQRFAVAVAPSSRLAMRRTGRAEAVAGPAIAAFGDPVFANVARDSTARGWMGARDASLQRLPRSGIEAQRVGAMGVRSLVLTRRDASESAIKRLLPPRLSVLHLATHALVDDRALGRNVIALAAGNGEDGFLTGAEIASLPLDVDLVVLSACRTAGGVIFAGEGVQGLTHPFFEAGARAIVATQWAVGDAATVPFVERFYGHLATGLDVSAALRQTKLEAIKAGVSIRQWAAFLLAGDGTVRPQLSRSNRRAEPWKVTDE